MNKEIDIKAMLREDARRRERRRAASETDPLRGRFIAGRTRVLVKTPERDVPEAHLPLTMMADPAYAKARKSVKAWRLLRCRHDFEYWCRRCVVIRHKTEGRDVPFVLNRAQRMLLDAMERDRLNNRPIRVILLKARQWGGSTLVQVYMAWIQSYHKRNWNSLICAHVKDVSAVIRGTYTKLIDNFPADMWDGDEPPQFRPFERAQNVREIRGRGCRVTISSSENQDAVRGADYAMAHLSETAFWKRTRQRSPEDYIRAVCGAIATVPLSLIVMESTANGVANYFHSEWMRCKEGLGDKQAIFIPWYAIDMYATEVPDREKFARRLNEYERELWAKGLDLDQIYWYHNKRLEMHSEEKLHAEFPTTDVEAFAATGNHVFSSAGIERLREGCVEARDRGEVWLKNGQGVFAAEAGGRFLRWRAPEDDKRYVVAVDVGGRSANADWSVVAVLREGVGDELAEVVGQWRGHCDHDILATQAEAIARYYNNAHLIIESNTLEAEMYGGSGDGSDNANVFVLNRLAGRYNNIYRRESFDNLTNRVTMRVGFHTNRSTKAVLINELIMAVRESSYIERDSRACDEYVTYEQRQNGVYAAKSGYHDDILMSRALALHALEEMPRRPRRFVQPKGFL